MNATQVIAAALNNARDAGIRRIEVTTYDAAGRIAKVRRVEVATADAVALAAGADRASAHLYL